MLPSTLSPPLAFSASVVEYCTRHSLRPSLEAAVRLAESSFRPIQGMDVSVEKDPETDEDYLVIDVSVALDVDEVVARKREYIRRWVQHEPAPVRERIRLAYNIR